MRCDLAKPGRSNKLSVVGFVQHEFALVRIARNQRFDAGAVHFAPHVAGPFGVASQAHPGALAQVAELCLPQAVKVYGLNFGWGRAVAYYRYFQVTLGARLDGDGPGSCGK